jgi:predicted dehydrogenase
VEADPVRIAVVGVGALALRGLLPHLTQEDVQQRVRVVAVCDPAIERATTAADRFGVPRAFATLEDLLATDDLDAVSIATPIGLHHEHCRLALEAGKHVHVNKTMTTSVAEASDLIDLAQDRHLQIVASPGEVLRPQVTRTRELIAEGAIGLLAWAACGAAFGAYHEEDEPERSDTAIGEAINPSWYFRKPGGGPMFDMTSYSLHQLTSILGPATRVTGLSGVRIRERHFLGNAIETEADDNTILLLDFGDSVFAVVYGTAAGELSPQFGAGTYFGTAGVIEGALLNGEPFQYPGKELTDGAPVTDWEAQMRVLPDVVGPHRQIPESHVFQDVMQLVDWVRDGKPSPVTAEHARHVIEIIESGYSAAATGSAQELRTTFEWAGSVAPATVVVAAHR